MKIIHLVLGKANPDRMNGVNKVAHNHATYMTQLGHQVTLWGITANTNHDYPERNYKTVLFKTKSNRFALHADLSQALDALDRDTVFHIHGALIPEFFLVIRKLKKKNIPFIYTPHGAFNEIALLKNRWIKKIYIALIERFILRNARKVHFLGQSEFSNIDQLLPLSNKILIPNGQDLTDLAFEYRQLQPLEEPVFGFCGRLDSYYKSLDMLLSAFANYKLKKGTGVLWIIGDGADRYTLEKQAEDLHIQQHVRFFGSMFGQEKLNRIANMSVFFHPSRSEGSPTAVLEACGLGVPCVVSTATNVGDQVDQYQCGIHLQVNNIQHITQAFFTCENLFYSGELKPMGEKAKEMVVREFDWSQIVGRLLTVYSES